MAAEGSAKHCQAGGSWGQKPWDHSSRQDELLCPNCVLKHQQTRDLLVFGPGDVHLRAGLGAPHALLHRNVLEGVHPLDIEREAELLRAEHTQPSFRRGSLVPGCSLGTIPCGDTSALPGRSVGFSHATPGKVLVIAGF